MMSDKDSDNSKICIQCNSGTLSLIESNSISNFTPISPDYTKKLVLNIMDFYLGLTCVLPDSNTKINGVVGGSVDPNCEYYHS